VSILHISVFLLLCLRQVHLFFFGYTLLLVVSRTIYSVVTCEGGNLSLSYYPLPSQNPRSPGTSPLGLTTLNRKNHPIEVTLGGIGSSYASLTLQSLAFILATNCAITIFSSLSGNTESIIFKTTFFGKPCLRILILQAYLATPLRVFPLSFDSFKKIIWRLH
jgi:hypothetical protein